MNVTVVVPWRGGCPHRERAWAWVRRRYAQEHPDWRLVEAVAPDGPWCKAAAATSAIEAADDGVVIVADADVFCARNGLKYAADVVASGLADWAVPHFRVYRLDERGTDLLLAGESGFAEHLAQEPYRGVMGGGAVVARRDTLIDTPLDPRFEGWGQEDVSWATALATLHGPAWRGEAPLWHLWHPPQQRMNRKVGSPGARALHRRYATARRDPAVMRALIEEVRHDSRSPAQHAGHDHASRGGRLD